MRRLACVVPAAFALGALLAPVITRITHAAAALALALT